MTKPILVSWAYCWRRDSLPVKNIQLLYNHYNLQMGKVRLNRCSEHDVCVVLTGACAVVYSAFLWMSPQPALEAVLPELREPGVPRVGIWLQVEIIIIKPGHVRRLQLYCDSACCFLLVSISHIIPVSPAVTGQDEDKRAGLLDFFCMLAAKQLIEKKS